MTEGNKTTMTTNALDLCNACDSAPATVAGGYCRPCATGGQPPIDRAGCRECGRIFDLLDPTDAAEWAFGHDCEG